MADPIDELFTVPPQEFVARRNDLAKALRKERRRDEAKEVAALRRPTAPLWALNQLARRHPDDVAQLLEAGADLPAAQDALLAGDQDRFRDAVAHHRQLVSRLAGLGARIVEEAGASATDQRQDIATELQAASTIPEAAEPFRQGRLDQHPAELGEPVTGLPGGGGSSTPAPPARRSAGRSADRHGEGDRDGAEREAAQRERAEREAAERDERQRAVAAAEARVAAAQESARRARDEHRELAGAVADLEADLQRARRRLQAAAERLGDSEDDLADAERALRSLR